MRHGDLRATVELTAPEYESIRASSRRFFVVKGHELADVETVISASSRDAVVEKLPESGSLVDATDPRRDQHWSHGAARREMITATLRLRPPPADQPAGDVRAAAQDRDAREATRRRLARGGTHGP